MTGTSSSRRIRLDETQENVEKGQEEKTTEKEARKDMTTVPPLTERELDIIEDVLGPKILFLLNKAWEERRSVLRHKRSVQGTIKFCKEEDKRELLYWENKLEETEKVLEHMNETIRAIILALELKVEPEFYERILKLSDPWNKGQDWEEEEEELL